MRVVTWNILAQTTVPDGFKTLNERLPCFLNYLQSVDADIVCLQEVMLSTFENDFKVLFKQYNATQHGVCIYKGKRQAETFGNVTLWKRDRYIKKDISTSKRCLHVKLVDLEQNVFVVSNVHLPAKPGLEGYMDKIKCLDQCVAFWDIDDVLMVGDFNCGLAFKKEDGTFGGLHSDLVQLGFIISPTQLSKLTCKSFRGNIYNVDYVLGRGNFVATYLKQDLDVTSLPSDQIPSDHLPLLYFVEKK